MISKPLLKWPGGKTWLARLIAPHLTGHYSRFFEPFLGGGAFLFALQPQQAFVSDINEDLIQCYMAIQRNAGAVHREWSRLRFGKASYYNIRDRWSPRSANKKAARFIYLLQHSWNGLYRVNRSGRFNVPFCPRVRKKRLSLKALKEAQAMLTRVSFRVGDFESTVTTAGPGDLVFADPPYFCGNGKTFTRYSPIIFSESDQARLCHALRSAEAKGVSWILTNGSKEQLEKHLFDYAIYPVMRNSTISADSRFRGSIFEYVVLSKSLHQTRLNQLLQGSVKGKGNGHSIKRNKNPQPDATKNVKGG